MRPLGRLQLAFGGATLADLPDRIGDLHRDRVLVEEFGGDPLRARDVADRVARWSGGIAAAIAPGDRVVLAFPNGYDLLLAALAVCRAGGVAVPVNIAAADELEHIVTNSGATLVVRSAGEMPEGPVAPPASVDADAVAAIFYTSGTTGRPKGAELTHRGLLQSVRAAALWPRSLRRDEAVIALPVAHIMGFSTLLSLAVAGIPVCFLPHFRPDDVLDAIEERQATVFVGVPAMYRMLLEAGAEDRDLGSVRVWASGADVMPPDLARRFQRMGATVTVFGIDLGEAAFAEGYGMVELSGGVAAKLSPPFFPVALGESLGFPLPPNRFRVVGDDGEPVGPGEVGELQVRGPGVLRGYHGDPDATRAAVTADGWLRTGDLARRGPFGVVLFAGRAQDRIKSGGYSVFGGEIERVLEEHPDVAEAAATGIADERLGEVPAAAVRLHPAATVTASELEAWAADRLSTYKRPRRIVIVDSLPRTGTEKVRRQGVKALLAAATAPTAGPSPSEPSPSGLSPSEGKAAGSAPSRGRSSRSPKERSPKEP